MNEELTVEVVYALPQKQQLIQLQLAFGATAKDAVVQSGISRIFPEIDIEALTLGIYSQHIETDYELKEGDRVEIYRPLLADPKEVRKRRAAEMAAKRPQKQ